ncbi:putative Papain family cysteine protease Protein of unknown function (DUF3586) [Trypanosoma vivax]|nr:putative Papain family cysteine protease Protein of unknown function (DUF3586) [Trypanosoma vivax]
MHAHALVTLSLPRCPSRLLPWRCCARTGPWSRCLRRSSRSTAGRTGPRGGGVPPARIRGQHAPVADVRGGKPARDVRVTPFSDLTPEEFRTRYHNGERPLRGSAGAREDAGAGAAGQGARRRGLAPQGCGDARQGPGQLRLLLVLLRHWEHRGPVGGCRQPADESVGADACVVDTKDNGCGGGFMDNAFEWIVKENSARCTRRRAIPTSLAVARSRPASRVGTRSVHDHRPRGHPARRGRHRKYLATTAGRCGRGRHTFMSYSGGWVTSCTSEALNHGVLLVGYNDSSKAAVLDHQELVELVVGREGLHPHREGHESVSGGAARVECCCWWPRSHPTPTPRTTTTTTTTAPGPSSSFTKTLCSGDDCADNCSATVYTRTVHPAGRAWLDGGHVRRGGA